MKQDLLQIRGWAILLWILLATLIVAPVSVAQDDQQGTNQQPAAKKRVLLLGDSISIGYHSTVREELKDIAEVFRPMNQRNRPENCAGTKNGVKHIDRWLKIDGGNFDVIHFNFGLHDLKRVDAKSGRNSNNPEDPRQSEPEQYEKQLREIVAKLKQIGAQLIFCNTTPVPEGVRPHRDTTDPGKYNAIAARIMQENEIPVNDLYSFANQRLDKIQQKANVHFSKQGSAVLGKQVAHEIRKFLELKKK